MKKTTLEILVIRSNVILYRCSNCKIKTPIDKKMLMFRRCPRCDLEFKNTAKIIRGGNELYDSD